MCAMVKREAHETLAALNAADEETKQLVLERIRQMAPFCWPSNLLKMLVFQLDPNADIKFLKEGG